MLWYKWRNDGKRAVNDLRPAELSQCRIRNKARKKLTKYGVFVEKGRNLMNETWENIPRVSCVKLRNVLNCSRPVETSKGGRKNRKIPEK